MNRLLVAAAGLCLVAGAALGAWGWADRDASRGRIVPAVEGEDRGLAVFAPEPEPDPYQRACQVLLSAATLQFPVGVPSEDPWGPPTTVPQSRQTARGLVVALRPELVEGLPGLGDDPELVAAMAALRGALERALDEGDAPLADPQVQEGSRRLSLAALAVC